MSISVDKLAGEVAEILDQFQVTTELALQEAVDGATKEIVKELQTTSPKRTGNYAKSWTRTGNEMKGQLGYKRIVYVRAPHYRLTHLLEFGHPLPQGGRAKAYPHIAKAEQRGIENFETKLLEGLK